MNVPRLLRLAALALLCALPAFCDTNVFDMPARHMRHVQLLGWMDSSHRKQDYAAMEAVCREGVALESAAELWHYNLACALALQNRADEALDALDQAIAAGFLDSDHLSQDSDLDTLRATDRFAACLSRVNALREAQAAHPAPLPVAAPDPKTQTVMQSASNTLWNFRLGLFNAFLDLPQKNPPAPAYRGAEADAINAWLRDGTASGTAGLLYVNRDNHAHPFDTARLPGVSRLGYAQDMIDRNLHIGIPNTLFAQYGSGTLTPVLGHSSLGFLDSPYWRSQPRALCGDPRQVFLQSVLMFGNQLFFYPVYGDYDPRTEDLFPANIPYVIPVMGQNNAERPFIDAAFAALAAMRPETRALLTRTGLLMPTLSMLFRASQRTVASPADYLTGIAHPPVFQPARLDTARLVRMAHALTTNSIPPLVILEVLSETGTVPGRDFFDIPSSENLFDSPLAIARVFRGTPYTRTLELAARCKTPHDRIHWRLLQGDPSRVTFTPNPTNSAHMTLTVAHHATPFETPAGNGKTLRTSRVDIGVIAQTGENFSLPSVISFVFLGNERRVYDRNGKILSVDYTRQPRGYIDPLMTVTRNWKDTYRYDTQGNQIGWDRTRGLNTERFTAFGHLVVSADARGRATVAHLIRYVPRQIKISDSEQGLPDLAQLDDNLAVTYRYADDADLVGQPDLSRVTQETQPPEQAAAAP